ncbi:hypothetical protein A0O28_0099740 [Trichoderma guizhouense]|uniref:Uncharacterized protein n=1 Tax=Trichoderma guizhouense TaxID=1491466 RepID=A0A1T3CRK6_9HYPO|nr:hypothetical protein A0O28_0099740 [Trichoderma guizhouense]
MNSNATIPTPERVSDAWSIKTRSGSPPPMLEAGDAGSAKMPKDNAAVKTQDDLLCGVGSQFLIIGMLWSSH